MKNELRAPFPWFGGKSKIADVVWDHLGDPKLYIEPFCGSIAVLLKRPNPSHSKREIINDYDCMVVNFWRSMQWHYEQLAHDCDWPITQSDLYARHKYLVENKPILREKIMADPHYCDPKIAAWWAWGKCIWYKAGWCNDNDPENVRNPYPLFLGQSGVHKLNTHKKELLEWFSVLQKRLRNVFIFCSDAKKLMRDEFAHSLKLSSKNGVTAIFLDPPYDPASYNLRCYADNPDKNIAVFCRDWAIENTHNSRLKIALCGFHFEHDLPSDWIRYRWDTGCSGKNRNAECIWFSPNCRPKQTCLNL